MQNLTINERMLFLAVQETTESESAPMMADQIWQHLRDQSRYIRDTSKLEKVPAKEKPEDGT